MALNLVGVSQLITASSDFGGGGGGTDGATCQTGQINTELVDQCVLCLCKGCDSACGRITYYGTGDAFVGYRSEPLGVQQSPGGEPGEGIGCPVELPCCFNSFGDCQGCPSYPDPDTGEMLEDSGYNCSCFSIDGRSSLSYGRFSNKQFMTVKENGVYKNQKMLPIDFINYKNKPLKVLVAQVQGHDINCRPQRSNCVVDAGQEINTGGDSINSSRCLTNKSFGQFPCSVSIDQDGIYRPNFRDFYYVGPMFQNIFSNGLNAVKNNYGVSTGQQEAYAVLPGVVELNANEEEDDPLYAFTRCEYQNYSLGLTPLPPGLEGITAVVYADHLNQTFTPNVCSLIDNCSIGGAEDCDSFYLADCVKEVDTLCFRRAERYGIIKGCTSAGGFTLNGIRYDSANKDPFVFFFQGIRMGNWNTATPLVDPPMDPIIGEPLVSFGVTYANCFHYYETSINPNFQCKQQSTFNDPMYYMGSFRPFMPYLPNDINTCDVPISNNLFKQPPQSTGCCYRIDRDGSRYSAQDQFRTIEYFSKNSPHRTKLISEYILPIIGNVANYGQNNGTSDFMSEALCKYFMPRHPYLEASEFDPFGRYYGYKPTPGSEADRSIDLCPRYYEYKLQNELKDGDNRVLIPGHPDAYYSLEGEIFCAKLPEPELGKGGGEDDGEGDGEGGGGGGVGFGPDQENCFLGVEFPINCFQERGLQNPLFQWPATQEEKEADRCRYTNNAYEVKIIGHSNNSLLPGNNQSKYFNACFPCRGFIDLPPTDPANQQSAIFTEYQNISTGSQDVIRLIIKSYTRDGNYSNHTVGSILARMTLKDQIKQNNIYFTDVAEFMLMLVGSGVEVLHTREVLGNEYYSGQQSFDTEAERPLFWETVQGNVPKPSEYRARKMKFISNIYGPPHDEGPIKDSDLFFSEFVKPINASYQNSAYNTAEHGGYIGVNGQYVCAYVGPNVFAGSIPDIMNFYETTAKPEKVYGLFPAGDNPLLPPYTCSSDRNHKVNNNIGILKIHKDLELEPGRTVPHCREKFETLDGSITNCDLPNNLVMSGLCWITSTIEEDLWENGGVKDYAQSLEITEAVDDQGNQIGNSDHADFTNFDSWVTTTRIPLQFLRDNITPFLDRVSSAIGLVKQSNPAKYIGNGQFDSIPTPISEEWYLIRSTNGRYSYTFDDFRNGAIKSKENDYSCYDPDSVAVPYSCAEQFPGCSLDGLDYCELGEANTLENLEATLTSTNVLTDQCRIDYLGPNGIFASMPSDECLLQMAVNWKERGDIRFYCPEQVTSSKIKTLIQIMLDNRSNPCVFQYNNKVYRVMRTS